MCSRLAVSLLGCWLCVVDAQVLQDPTRPVGAPADARRTTTGNVEGMVLNAVFVAEQGSHALINNTRMSIGDSIQGAILTQIDVDSVTLVHNQKEHKLRLKKQIEEIKTDVSNQF